MFWTVQRNAQNAKIVALSGTPLINDPFEAAILFNILRGYIEITYFSIVRVPGVYGEEWKLGDLEEELMSNSLIDYLEINKIIFFEFIILLLAINIL